MKPFSEKSRWTQISHRATPGLLPEPEICSGTGSVAPVTIPSSKEEGCALLPATLGPGGLPRGDLQPLQLPLIPVRYRTKQCPSPPPRQASFADRSPPFPHHPQGSERCLREVKTQAVAGEHCLPQLEQPDKNQATQGFLLDVLGAPGWPSMACAAFRGS